MYGAQEIVKGQHFVNHAKDCPKNNVESLNCVQCHK